MKNKNKRLIKMVSIISLFSLLCLVYAQNSSAQEAHYRPTVKDKANIFDGLNLTPEQQEKIKAHKEENVVKTNSLRDQMKNKREELRVEMKNPNMDLAKVQSLTNDVKNLIGQLIDLKVDGVVFLKQTLTPEQFVKFQEILKEKFTNNKGQNQREKIKEKLKQKRMQLEPKTESQGIDELSSDQL